MTGLMRQCMKLSNICFFFMGVGTVMVNKSVPFLSQIRHSNPIGDTNCSQVLLDLFLNNKEKSFSSFTSSAVTRNSLNIFRAKVFPFFRLTQPVQQLPLFALKYAKETYATSLFQRLPVSIQKPSKVVCSILPFDIAIFLASATCRALSLPIEMEPTF